MIRRVIVGGLRCLHRVFKRKNVEAISQETITLERQIAVFAQLDCPTLIIGECGVGKKTVARQIHRASSRAEQPFYMVSCNSRSYSKLKSTLFDKQTGLLTASQGTVYLSKLDALPLDLQAELLDLLDQKKVTARILVSTRREYCFLFWNKKLTKTLLQKLRALLLHVPPLRMRTGEIPEFSQNYLARLARKFRRPEPILTQRAVLELQQHSWPGNFTELKAVLSHAFFYRKGGAFLPSVLDISFFSPNDSQENQKDAFSRPASRPSLGTEETFAEIEKKNYKGMNRFDDHKKDEKEGEGNEEATNEPPTDPTDSEAKQQ